ncbi:collagen alpha-1(XII) chain-like [Thunnus thynnus]|uniref:collagen alpha-1(XII) chain-like n=1 Tax=Thunnus thynnus TaxID=8237 RepID=UPI00352986EF
MAPVARTALHAGMLMSEINKVQPALTTKYIVFLDSRLKINTNQQVKREKERIGASFGGVQAHPTVISDTALVLLQHLVSCVSYPTILCFPPGSQCESTAKADIVLLVDDSGSISSNDYKNIKSFLTQTVSNFDIGPDKVQIGLVQYSSNPKTKWQLNTHQTKQSLLKAIAKLHQRGGGTNTGKALKHILHNNFKPNVGMRADSHKIAIVITDGKSSDDVFLASQHLKDAGIEIYAIGVMNAEKNELKAIASYPVENHVYMLSDFSSLLNIIDDFTSNLCNSINGSLGLQAEDKHQSTGKKRERENRRLLWRCSSTFKW